MDENMIRSIVAEVLREQLGTIGFEKKVDPSGVLWVKSSSVRCEPFQQNGVYVKDVTTLEEAPRMGCGIMELDHTTFPWTLSYDEYDLVLEGVLEIAVDGRVLTGHPGDILYIPKNTAIEFRTPSKARYAYFVYPANWQ